MESEFRFCLFLPGVAAAGCQVVDLASCSCRWASGRHSCQEGRDQRVWPRATFGDIAFPPDLANWCCCSSSSSSWCSGEVGSCTIEASGARLARSPAEWIVERVIPRQLMSVRMWKVLLELISTESEWPDRARLTGWFAAIGCLPRFTRTSEINYFWLLQCSNWVIKEIFCSSAPAVWVHLGVGVGSIRVGDCRRMGHPALRRIYVSALVFYHCNLIIILFFSIISTFYGHCWSLVSNWGPLAMIYADLCC